MYHNYYHYYYVYFKYLAFVVLAATLPVLGLIVLKIFQKLSAGKCKSLTCLKGKTVIVTGGCSGIGFQTALVLASRGGRIILADRVDGTRAKNKIIEKTNNSDIVTKHLDLASLKSVRKFAEEIKNSEDRLDILINNAGVGSVGNKHTEDGLHSTMQINHFGPFLLTYLLTDLLKKSAPSRIIFVSSAGAYINNLSISNLNYPENHPMSVLRNILIYGNSKLCSIITANGFAERLQEFGVTSNSLHPGLVNTQIYTKFARLFGLEAIAKIFVNSFMYIYGKSLEEGAQTTIHLALSHKLETVTGKHFWDCMAFPAHPFSWNKKFCDAIWEKSEELVGLKSDEKLVKIENLKQD